MSKSGITAAVFAVLSLVVASAFTTRSGSTGTVYFGMDSPLTGAQQVVGQGDRDAVQALVAYWNAHGGIKGSEVVVDILDNASNPSQAVQNVQQFIGDSKYVAILGSGNAAAAVATGPLASQAKIPFIALSPPTNSRRAAAALRLILACDLAPVRLQPSRVPARAGDQEGLADGRQRRLRPGRPGAGAEAREQVRARDRGHDDLRADDDATSRRSSRR